MGQFARVSRGVYPVEKQIRVYGMGRRERKKRWPRGVRVPEGGSTRGKMLAIARRELHQVKKKKREGEGKERVGERTG